MQDVIRPEVRPVIGRERFFDNLVFHTLVRPRHRLDGPAFSISVTSKKTLEDGERPIDQTLHQVRQIRKCLFHNFVDALPMCCGQSVQCHDIRSDELGAIDRTTNGGKQPDRQFVQLVDARNYRYGVTLVTALVALLLLTCPFGVIWLTWRLAQQSEREIDAAVRLERENRSKPS
jgi:hypothetical protein